MRRKIVVLGSSLNDKGGIVTVMKNIEQSYLKEKFEFIHLDTYDTCSSFKKIFIFLKGCVKYLSLILNKKDIEIVHIHMSYKGSFYRKSLLILVSSLFNKKIVLHMHGSCFKEFYNSLNKIQKKYCKNIFNKVDKLIVLSESWKEFFKTIVLDQDKICVIHNSIPIKEENRYMLKNKKIVSTIVFMGRLGERKGIYDLLDVISDIYNENKYKDKFKLIVAGDGEIDKVNSIIKMKNLQNIVSNKGWVENNERDEILKEGDIFVLPSYNEGLPMAILESMSYHLVCISTNVGGIPEVIMNGVNGYIYEPGNNKMLSKYIKELIDNQEKRINMSKKSFNIVYDNFNQNKELNKIKELYEELLKIG